MNMRARALAVTGAALLALPALAVADVRLSSNRTAENPTAHRGLIMWSVAGGDGRHRLIERDVRRNFVAPVKAHQEPFDVDLGPSAIGTIASVYARCEGLGAEYDCDLHLFDPTSTFDFRPPGLSTRACLEVAPSIWRSRIVFARRVPEGELPGRPRCRRPGLYLSKVGGPARRIGAAVPFATDAWRHLVAASYLTATRDGGTASRVLLFNLRSGARRVIATGRTDPMGRGELVSDPAFDRGTLHYLLDEGVTTRRVVGRRVAAGGADVVTDARAMDSFAVHAGRLYYASREGIFEYR